jgi:hypothetical protein
MQLKSINLSKDMRRTHLILGNAATKVWYNTTAYMRYARIKYTMLSTLKEGFWFYNMNKRLQSEDF